MHFRRASSMNLSCCERKQVSEVFLWDENSLKSSAFRQKWVRFSTSFFSSLSRDAHLELLKPPTKTHPSVISKRVIFRMKTTFCQFLQIAVLELIARSSSGLKIILLAHPELPCFINCLLVQTPARTAWPKYGGTVALWVLLLPFIKHKA